MTSTPTRQVRMKSIDLQGSEQTSCLGFMACEAPPRKSCGSAGSKSHQLSVPLSENLPEADTKKIFWNCERKGKANRTCPERLLPGAEQSPGYWSSKTFYISGGGELQSRQQSGRVFLLPDVVHQLNLNYGQGLSDDYNAFRVKRSFTLHLAARSVE